MKREAFAFAWFWGMAAVVVYCVSGPNGTGQTVHMQEGQQELSLGEEQQTGTRFHQPLLVWMQNDIIRL